VVVKVRRLSGEQGNALVEFSLSVFVLLTLLFGIIDIGRALYAYDWIYNAARQATRWAMVRGNPCDSLLPGCDAQPPRPTGNDIQNYVRDTPESPYTDGLDTTGIDTSAVTVTSTCFATNDINPNPPCAPAGFIQIQVKYVFHPITPFLGQFNNDTMTMTSTSQRVVQ
jgi:Flp pilus assembly protein TadG